MIDIDKIFENAVTEVLSKAETFAAKGNHISAEHMITLSTDISRICLRNYHAALKKELLKQGIEI